MVCIANYDESQTVIGCTRSDGVSGGLEFIAQNEALGFTITYKTQAELDADVVNKVISDKWQLVDEYMATLEITSDILVGGNKFKADTSGIRNIESAIHGMISTSTKYWVEDWGSFTTDVTELEWVLKEAQRLKEAKIVEVGL